MVASSISYRVVCRSDVAVSRVLRLIQACGERSLILSIVAHLGLRSGSRTQKRRRVRFGSILLKKDFEWGLRATLIQGERRTSNIDSKLHLLGFDCFKL